MTFKEQYIKEKGYSCFNKNNENDYTRFLEQKLRKKTNIMTPQVKQDNFKKEFICCDNITIENTRCKYPNGLPLETIEITYCSSCDRIHDVSW